MIGSPRQATVLGATGYIGRALVAHLRTIGWQVWVPEKAQLWPVLDQPLGHVFYCVGMTADYLQHPALTLEAHTSLLSRVLQSSHFDSLVYLSSTRLYDALPANHPACETDALPIQAQNPRHLYDLTKLTGESLCHLLGMGKARVARLACVYDFGGEATGFLPGLMRQLMKQPRATTIKIESSPQYARDYVHLGDVTESLVRIATQGQHAVYNVAQGCNTSNHELAQWVAKATGCTIDWQLPPTLHFNAPPSICIERLRGEQHIHPQSVEHLLRDTLKAVMQTHVAN